jgi:hypothetical protein
MINYIFLAIVVIQVALYPVGTFFHYESTGYEYEMGLTDATFFEENNSLVATFQVTNYHQNKLFVGEPNVEAYNLDTGKTLDKFSCLRPFQVILNQNQTDSGQVCWISSTKLNRVKIIYYHSAFSGETFGWIVGE